MNNGDLKAWAIGAALLAVVIGSIVWATLIYNVQWQKNRCESVADSSSRTVWCLGPIKGD